ncbi:hypothetical protein BJ138DRAFT_1140433 [Hygrophoropsis aurantiaca]|uniref:Uncharacterized protein n=1 Tax=Hygrophoropsis aurantiaca TaxID=72124 RepID=A0ACB8ARQ2_9AGAM|nr:hypothetical protein BJ138DRAFT_1140433 [Hygrophoropsis aurantiaca]
MVALNLKSAILITLSYIISFAGAKPVSNCVVPHAQLGPSLGIYERSYCTTESEFDIFFLRGAPLEGNWDPDKCQCVEFKSQLPDGVRSIVFQPGREPQKVSVLLVQNESCDFPPNEKYDGELNSFLSWSDVERGVSVRTRFSSRGLCFRRSFTNAI